MCSLTLSECTLTSEVCDALGDELRRGLGRRGGGVGARVAAREHEAGAHADRPPEGDIGVGAVSDHESAARGQAMLAHQQLREVAARLAHPDVGRPLGGVGDCGGHHASRRQELVEAAGEVGVGVGRDEGAPVRRKA